jgi:hypothetical protein
MQVKKTWMPTFQSPTALVFLRKTNSIGELHVFVHACRRHAGPSPAATAGWKLVQVNAQAA